MMRKTMEKRRDFDIKQWKKNGKAMENFSRTLLAQRVSTEKILWEYHLKVNSLAFLVKLVQFLQILL